MQISREFSGCLLASATAFLLFLAGIFDTLIGPLASFFASTPLIWLAYRFGAGTGCAASVLAASALLPAASLPVALSFLAGSALPGTLMGHLFRRGEGTVSILLYGTFASLLLSLAGSVLYFAAAGLDPVTFFRYHIGDMLREAVRTMEAFSGNTGDGHYSLPPQFVRALPAMIFLTVFIQHSLNLLLVRYGAARFIRARDTLPDYTRFALPEQTVWVLIPLLAGQWAPVLSVRTAAVNLLIVVLFFYLLQGLSILIFFIRRLKASRPFFMVCVIAFLLQPYLLVLPLLAGLLDFRFGFRSRWPGPARPS